MKGTGIDFMRPPAAPQLGWWLLAAGVMTMLVALEFQRRWTVDRREAQRVEQSVEEARRAQARPTRPAEQTLAQRRWTQIQPELRRPWLPMLRAVEAASSDPIYLLSLGVEPESGVVRLEAEAPDFGSALTYVQQLGQDGALQAGTLVSHEEIANPAVPGRLMRFSVSTRWSTR